MTSWRRKVMATLKAPCLSIWWRPSTWHCWHTQKEEGQAIVYERPSHNGYQQDEYLLQHCCACGASRTVPYYPCTEPR